MTNDCFAFGVKLSGTFDKIIRRRCSSPFRLAMVSRSLKARQHKDMRMALASFLLKISQFCFVSISHGRLMKNEITRGSRGKQMKINKHEEIIQLFLFSAIAQRA